VARLLAPVVYLTALAIGHPDGFVMNVVLMLAFDAFQDRPIPGDSNSIRSDHWMQERSNPFISIVIARKRLAEYGHLHKTVLGNILDANGALRIPSFAGLG
jgi:hypothetical protein